MEVNALSLFELNQQIKNVLKSSFSGPVWLIAEISELKENRNGHCYLELVEKDPTGNRIKARSRAIIWAYTYRMLKPYFETSTGQMLQAGIKIMVSVTVEFHEQYGLSFEIKDIEPSFTIGEIEKQKQEILERLIGEGVLDMNKQTDFPLCPQKIAIISSPTAAGYTDFMNQITQNAFGYKFYIKLFPAVMQGMETEASISTALEKIYNYEDFFDIVVIIRGGGASIDLNCFNNYNLAFLVTQFPVPVLTGIGHEKDETILDVVAYQKLKTPTAVAEFLIDRLHSFETQLDEIYLTLADQVGSKMIAARNELAIKGHKLSTLVSKSIAAREIQLERMKTNLPRLADKLINKKQAEVSNYIYLISKSIPKKLKQKQEQLLKVKLVCRAYTNSFLKTKKLTLRHCDEVIRHMNPENILKRGYSITLNNGSPVLSAKSLKKGDEIETLLYQGRVKSTVSREDSNNE